MTRALDSAIGLPSRSTRAVRMLSLLMPDEVSRNFMMPLLADGMGAARLLQSFSLSLLLNPSGRYLLCFSQLHQTALRLMLAKCMYSLRSTKLAKKLLLSCS